MNQTIAAPILDSSTAAGYLISRFQRASEVSTYSARKPFPGTKHIPALDGLRGVAVLLVVVFHFHYIFAFGPGPEGVFYRCLDFGWCGVNLFFALSGFLITGILLDTKNSKSFFTTFYARRAIRIFPLYYAFLLFVFALNQAHYLLPSIRPVPTHWGSYLLYLQNMEPVTNIRLGHLWSLAVEEQFYLFWPALVYLVPSRYLVRASVTLAICCFVFRCGVIALGVSFPVFVSVVTRLDELVLGSLVAMIVRRPALLEYVRRKLWIGLTAGFLVLLATAIDYRLMNTIGLSALGVLFSSSVLLTVESSGALARVLSVSWLRSVGRYGYAIYILHPTLFAATAGPLRHATEHLPSLWNILLKLAYIPVMVTLSVLAGKLSWLVFEQRLQNLKHLFPYRSRDGAALPEA